MGEGSSVAVGGSGVFVGGGTGVSVGGMGVAVLQAANSKTNRTTMGVCLIVFIENLFSVVFPERLEDISVDFLASPLTEHTSSQMQ